MNKKVKINLGGKDIDLNFEPFYFYEVFRNETGVDLLSESVQIVKGDSQQTELFKMLSGTDYIKYASGIIYAGYAADFLIKDKEPELTYKMVKHMVSCLSFEEIAKIVELYNSTQSDSSEKKETSQSIQA